jgi:uncharacterized protein with PIN domain
MKFVADSMLGRLAKWLRILGFDVAYFPRIEDKDLVEFAIKEGRILLTRDTLLVKRRKIQGQYFFVEGNHFREQLRQVVTHFSLPKKQSFLTRCIRCNQEIAKIEKEAVRGKVPVYVFNTQNIFGICHDCKRIYWQATHKENMEKEIDQ